MSFSSMEMGVYDVNALRVLCDGIFSSQSLAPPSQWAIAYRS